MARMKVYELAKELGKTSKEMIEYLSGKNIEVKSHMSALEEDQVEMLKKEFGKKEAPKTKNIVRVFRPQNSRDAARAGRQPGRAVHGGRTVVGGNRQSVPGQRMQSRRPLSMTGERLSGENTQSGRPQAARPARPQAERPQSERPQSERPQSERPQAARPVRPQAERLQSENAQSERPQAARPARPQAERIQGERPQGDRPQAARPARPQGERAQGDRPQAARPARGQGERFQGERTQGDRFQGKSRGERNQGNRTQGDRDQGTRRTDHRDHQGKKSQGMAVPVMEGQKPQRSKGKGKDDYRKKDYRENENERLPKGRKKNEPKQQIQKPQQKEVKQEQQIKSIVIPEVLTIKELADKMKIVPSVIVKKLFMQGKIVTVNQEIDYATAEEIALEFDVLCEKEEVVDVIEELLKEDEEDEKKMKKRPPVVCVMGHVDHGKTSLLDAIRHTNVIDREAGGITQHIGAYVAEINGEKITFLDTPGHEAFTAMRMRGANSTDIAILVVAADDGVMPQTVEAINHAKAAGIEIVVAVNKIDKPSANVDRVKQELAEYDLIPEAWGGSTVFVPVSAKTGEGLEELMEMILLTAEMLELKANPNRRARGLVIEAQLDKGKGAVATVLVQKGTLRIGDAVSAGSSFGKVRAMMDDKGRRVKEAGPSVPVEILGLNDVPNAGEVFVGCKNDKEARNFAETFISQDRAKLLDETKSKLSLDDLFNQIQEGNLKELGIVVKADVQGSVEAIRQSLLKLSNDEVVVRIIHGGVGAINESDVILASASNAIIIGFNVRPDPSAKETADREGVDIRLYRVIYNAIEDVAAAMKGMLDPVYEEKVLGHAEVRQTFKASGVGTIAGSYVQDGVFERDCKARIIRDGIVIYDGKLASLKRFKDDVKEVRAGYECGFVFENYNDIKEGDVVEAYKMVEIPR